MINNEANIRYLSTNTLRWYRLKSSFAAKDMGNTYKPNNLMLYLTTIRAMKRY